MQKPGLVRKIYLYLFSLVGLVLVVIGAVQLVGLVLKAYIFTEADRYYEYPRARFVEEPPKIAPESSEPSTLDRLNAQFEGYKEPTREEIEAFEARQRTSNRQREAAEALAMIIIGAPLYFYHWRVVQRDRGKRLISN